MHYLISTASYSFLHNASSYLSHEQLTVTGISSNNLAFETPEQQLAARNKLQQYLGESYSITLNLLNSTPRWLQAINAQPLLLGLDLRGGIHFLMTVDSHDILQKLLNKRVDAIKDFLINQHIFYQKFNVTSQSITFTVVSAPNTTPKLKTQFRDMNITAMNNIITLQFNPTAIANAASGVLKQNIFILQNRVNELGVADPVIQQQGTDKIIVELPGIQDLARAQHILGSTATLEIHLVDDDSATVAKFAAKDPATVANFTLLANATHDSSANLLINKNIELTGDNIEDAQVGFDENGNPTVNISLNTEGANLFQRLTATHIGKRLAMVLVNRNTAKVVTAPVIRTAISGGKVQISGSMSQAEAKDVALLLRAGTLASPLQIIEERIIGPSLGIANIHQGITSIMVGFAAITVSMLLYYFWSFGAIAVCALLLNLLFMIALLSLLQATLTLPGMAAIALNLGVAIDSNVLINERIKEELRLGKSKLLAIADGYQHAWATILDSNITAFIAGLALLLCGYGPVKGFAIVHCIGIITSLFSAVFVSRTLTSIITPRTC
jgi:preprotein translocase subunit SecD